jgi:hypothetical protein
MADFRFLSRMETPPERQTRIFRLRQPEVTEDSVRRMAQRFGFEGNAKRAVLEKDRSRITYTEGQVSLTQYRGSGGLRYRNVARWQVDDGVSHVEVDDESAAHIARKHIGQMGLVSQGEYELVEVTRLRVGVANTKTGLSKERSIDVGVAFRRVIDGVPVEGVGGKLVLYVDHTGELTGVDRIWREIDGVHVPSERIQLRHPRLAEEDVSAYYQKSRGLIEVGGFRFGYFELGWEDEQQYLQPAYVIDLTLISANGHFRTGIEYVVPASVNGFEYGRLMAIPRRVEAVARQDRY